MAGLVPAIHAFREIDVRKAPMPGIKPGMTRKRFPVSGASHIAANKRIRFFKQQCAGKACQCPASKEFEGMKRRKAPE